MVVIADAPWILETAASTFLLFGSQRGRSLKDPSRNLGMDSQECQEENCK
jgi:hypothetical protein